MRDEGHTPPRPLTASVAAALVLMMGVFHCVIVVAPAMVLFVAHPDPPARQSMTAESRDVGGPIDRLLDDYGAYVAVLHGVLGITAIACGVGVWRCRSWARRGSQVVMGVLTLLWLGDGAIVVFMRLPTYEGPVYAAFFLFLRIAALGMAVVWASLTALPIWLLERREARGWLDAA